MLCSVTVELAPKIYTQGIVEAQKRGFAKMLQMGLKHRDGKKFLLAKFRKLLLAFDVPVIFLKSAFLNRHGASHSIRGPFILQREPT